jgi:hypothetical protein
MGGDRQGICLPAYGLRVLEKFTRIDNGLQFTPDSALGLPLTPPQILGPFYPVSERPDLAGDLTRPSGQQGEARGLYVMGRVLTRSRRPVARGSGIANVAQDRHAADAGENLLQESEPLARNIGSLER